MSTLVYNNVGLLRCQELEFSRTPQYQGPDYLWTHYRLVVRGVFNPEINAYNFATGSSVYQGPSAVLQDPGTAVPVTQAVPGARRLALIAAAGLGGAITPVGPARMTETTEAPLTDLAVRHQLSQPRFALFYAVGNTPVLVSPTVNQDGTEAASDANNGPFPLVLDIVQISGTRTFLVDFAIETYVNEAMLFANTASVLLSHRWEAFESLDQDYFSTRVVEGRAQFRTDRLALLVANPDNFRGALFHALPGAGWKRVDVQVHATEDGGVLEYRLTDKQLALSMNVAGVTRIEAFQTVEADSVSGTKLVRSMLGLGGGGTGGISVPATQEKNFFGVPVPTSMTSIFSGLFSGIAGAFGNFTNAFADNIPNMTVTVVARVWGLESTTRTNLENVAINIVLVRMAAAMNPLALFTAATHIRLQHDLAGKFVEVICTKTTPLTTASLFSLLRGGVANLPNVESAFPANNDDTTGILTTAHATVPPLGLPTRFNAIGVGTRGTFVEQLATAALLNADAVPQSPPAVFPSGDGVLDRTPP